MPAELKQLWVFLVIVFFTALAVVTYFGVLDAPPAALIAWTEWIASVVGVIASVVAVIVAARAIPAAVSWFRTKAGLNP